MLCYGWMQAQWWFVESGALSHCPFSVHTATPVSKKRPLRLEATADEDEPAEAKKVAIASESQEVKKPSASEEISTRSSEKNSKLKRSKRKVVEKDSRKRTADQLNFPEQLMQLINGNVAPEHVSWIDNEEAISFKTDGFQEHVLDKFFQGLKYDSFVRKLNRWYVTAMSAHWQEP